MDTSLTWLWNVAESCSRTYRTRLQEILQFSPGPLKIFSMPSAMWSESESGSVISDSLQPHGILQAWILEWVNFPLSRGSSQPRSPELQADSLPAEPQGEPKNTGVSSLLLLQRTFPIQELNRDLLHCRQILYQLSYQESHLLCQYLTICPLCCEEAQARKTEEAMDEVPHHSPAGPLIPAQVK